MRYREAIDSSEMIDVDVSTLVRAVNHWLHGHVSPEVWSALGTWTIAGIAAVVAFYVLRQVREARITREKQVQPNVVAYAALNPEVSQYLDFVVTNYGQTPAYHVKLKFPVLTVTPYENLVTGEHTTELCIPDEIAVLAPGQEWRTLWDSAIEREQHRNKNDGRDVLGSRFKGTVKFQDSDGHSFTNQAILDWNSFRSTLSVGADFRFRLEADTPPSEPVHAPPSQPVHTPPSEPPVHTTPPVYTQPSEPVHTTPPTSPRVGPTEPRITMVGHDEDAPAGQQDVFQLDDSTLGRGQVTPAPDGGPPQVTVAQTQPLPGVSPLDDGQQCVKTEVTPLAKAQRNLTPWILGGVAAVLAALGGTAAWVWRQATP